MHELMVSLVGEALTTALYRVSTYIALTLLDEPALLALAFC